MQTLVAYVENKPGVLNRVASLARRLAINIDSLTVGPTENEEIARMTIVAHTDEKGAHRLEASLEKLVDVLLAENISERSLLERDLALISSWKFPARWTRSTASWKCFAPSAFWKWRAPAASP